jgi:leucyl-tRNA---protein transferase
MKIFSSELGAEYSTLTFGYTTYAKKEAGDMLGDIYARGFLPYSGSPDSKEMFYMARSARLHLPSFELNSECRRVAKKFDGQYTRNTVSRTDFTPGEDFFRLWLEYFRRAHGAGVMPRARLEHILDFGIISHIGIYRNERGEVGGYTLEVHEGEMAHDWYQAWEEALDKSSFGMWLLIDIARVAKEKGARYYYPGTVYGANSYKTNFPNLEYWNGEVWAGDPKNQTLKELLKKDIARTLPLVDRWKEEHALF